MQHEEVFSFFLLRFSTSSFGINISTRALLRLSSSTCFTTLCNNVLPSKSSPFMSIPREIIKENALISPIHKASSGGKSLLKSFSVAHTVGSDEAGLRQYHHLSLL